MKKIFSLGFLFIVMLVIACVESTDNSSLLAIQDPILMEGNDRAGNEQLPTELKDLKPFKLELDGDSIDSGLYLNGKINIHFQNRKTFDWQSDIGIKYVFVKGGNAGNLYQYKQGDTMDKYLKAPNNRGGKQPEIGHITFYYEEESTQLFENPVIGDGADPWIIRHTDGYYYYTNTTGNNITIWKSKTISGLQDAENKVVWEPEAGAPNSAHIWAPEIHFIDDKWYIYFAASGGDMEKQRMHVLQSETSDPFSEYSYPEGTTYGEITTPSDKWAIDGTILEWNDKHYFAWSGWEGDINVRQNIYIAPMTNPWTISGKRVELSRPEFDWETIGEPHINEGPQFLRNDDGDLFLVYSASGSWTDDYKLGMLTFTGSDPLDPGAWEKSTDPVFEKDPAVGVYGPGHNGFFQSPDGTEDWIIYHAAKFQGAGWNRNVRMQKFTWNEDGTPNFGKPVATGSLLEAPSGEQAGTLTPKVPVVYRFEAEDADVHRARIVENTSASNQAKIGYIDYEDSFVKFDVGLPGGDYTLKIRYSSGNGESASHHVFINEKSMGEINYNGYGYDSWYFAEKDIHLDGKDNKIKLSKGASFAELDFIELVPKKPAYKYEAEHAETTKGQTVNTFDASNKQMVTVNKEDSEMAYRIKVEKSGTYNLELSYRNRTDKVNRHMVVINENNVSEITYPPTSESFESVSIPIELEAGIQTILLSNVHGEIDVDYIQLK
ncbi:family 43 glycosylhydrolase [Gracilibacillus caseinilyticus]|uniref:Family 43 glycosylhydrolase n=1 Tax=Gracilibacillus caseinilyticus TaxID=2932256 RepID=A0ABY4EQV5_9BACI|nr:family 43 glycosylhydrolase [Gracilibacillus caseinilyticus]UOQ46594.1 family 43 glycosylhydrolase [Gracilibacillus caseinilyticus]